MFKSLLLSIFILGTLTQSAWALSPGIEPSLLKKEALSTFQAYLRLDTSNPPGNELPSARFLKQILDREGIENQLFDLGNNRANLYAILRGNGSAKPLVFLHHMDVVPADPQYWSFPPFSGQIDKGFVYGRGAIDIKGKGVVDLYTMIRLKREKQPLKRDLIFLAVADEEVNSQGARWMIEHKPELFKNAEFLIDEGKTVTENELGQAQYAMVGIGEKSPLWLKLTFTGTPGHASIPMADNAVNRALNAAHKILNYSQEIPFLVLPGLEASLRLQYAGDVTRLPGFDKDMATSLKNMDFVKALAKQPELNAMLRNTISITGMQGSDKTNIIPNRATLMLDCRLLPGQDKEPFLAELKKVIGDPSVQIEIEEYYKSLYSSPDGTYFDSLKRVLQRHYPQLPVVPTIFTSSTDSSLFRALGINVYGFESYRVDEQTSVRAHGNDERLGVDGFFWGLDFLHELVLDLNS
jgi:acetylornithine deacetylase/succinyl-diaminopimelate desuccinylase-like protein